MTCDSMINKNCQLFPLFAALLALTGCVNLKPSLSQMRSFTLGPVAVDVVEAEAGVERALYIQRPQLPTFLDGSRLSYRTASGELKYLPSARWAEPLNEGVARAVALYLGRSGLGEAPAFYPWPNTKAEAAVLTLAFERFSANESGTVQIVVNWQVSGAGWAPQQTRFISESIDWEIDRPETLVAAFNQALAELAGEIADALSKK